jgi:hypothetical protein
MGRRSTFVVKPFTNPSGAIVYRVRGTLNGRRIRENYTDAAEAESVRLKYERDASALQSDHRPVLTWLTAEQVRTAERAQQMIGSRSLVAAAEALLAREPITVTAVPLAKLIAQMVAELRAANKAHETVENLRKRLDLMIRETGVVDVAEFVPDRIEPWIRAPHLKGRTQINRRAAVTRLARWLSHPKRRIVPRALFDDLEEIVAEGHPPRRLSVAQVSALLKAAAEHVAIERGSQRKAAAEHVAIERGSQRSVRMLTNYVLRTFVGLRPSEVLDLAAAPERVNLDEGYVFVGDPRSRTHRAVKLTPNAKAWLIYARDLAPEIVFKARLHERVKAAAGLLEVWEPDICRHTFGSFHLRRHRSDTMTADEMGNSVRVVRGFYAVPLTDEELAAFDRLLPPGWQWSKPKKKGAAPVPVRVTDSPRSARASPSADSADSVASTDHPSAPTGKAAARVRVRPTASGNTAAPAPTARDRRA